MSEGAVGGEAVSGEVASVGGEAAPAPVQGASATLAAVPQEAVAADPVAPSGDVPVAPAWQSGLDEDSIAFVSNKGWDRAENPVSEMLKGYRNAERLRGVQADKLVRIPEDGNEEQAAEFYSRLGVPESPEGYESPEVQVGGVPVQAEPLAAMSHALKHTPAQHEAFMSQVGAFLEASQAEQNEALNAKLSAEKVELDSEWGAVLEENTLAAKKGFGMLEWDASTIDTVEAALGYKQTMKLAALIGRMSGEAGRGDSGERDGGMTMAYGLTKEAARSQLANEGRELADKVAKGDSAAKQRLDNLNRVAFHS